MAGRRLLAASATIWGLYAMVKAVIEGDLHSFMAHLQYFKDVLALPRQHFSAVAA